MTLRPEEMVAIRQYFEQLSNEKDDRDHKRSLRLTAALGVVSAAIAGVIAWGTQHVYEEVITAAKLEARDYVQSPQATAEYTKNVDRANQEAFQAIKDAASARVAENESSSALMQISKQIAAKEDILKRLNAIDSISADLAGNPTFQQKVAEKLMPVIEDKLPAHYSVEPGAWQKGSNYQAFCQAGEKVVGGYCQLEAGNGDLFNAGIHPGGFYQCTWRSLDDRPLVGAIWAVCSKVQ